MGYSEIHCKLCGVSFTIGRIRQAHEPWQNGWYSREHRYRGYDGHLDDERLNFVRKEYIRRERCPSEAGCRNLDRKTIPQNTSTHADLANTLSFYLQVRSNFLEGSLTVESAIKPYPSGPPRLPDVWDAKMEDNGDDTDYFFESDVEDEPYEYQSEDDNLSSPQESHGVSIDLVEGNSSEHLTEVSPPKSARCDSYEAMRFASMSTYLATADPSAVPALHGTEMDTDHSSGTSDNEDRYENERMRKCAEKEHFAGPGCIHQRGYSGYSIGADEMKGCNVMQCLFRKEWDWSPEPDDQSFELSSNYYLSGLSGYVPSRDFGYPRYAVERHNHGDNRRPDDLLFDDAVRHSTPMPFHPTCFEIFTRVSRLRLGSIDIEGLATWRRHASNFTNEIPRHPAIRRAAEQEWKHVRGDEFLAANPVLIPALPAIFDNAIETDPTFSTQNSAFKNTPQHVNPLTQNPPASTDPFAALSREIILLLLSYLPSRAIARLRLSSPAFRHLPVSLFRHLLQTEMPFLWEIRETNPPSLWAIHTAASIQDCTMRPSRLAEQLRDEQNHYRKVIKEEMPEVWDAYREDQAWLNLDPELLAEEAKREMLRRHRESVPLPRFDTERMNWYKLYCGIVQQWDELKGLQNRKRIWEDMEKVVRLVRRYREQNEIAG